jgi:hypothetical protein
MRWCRLTGYRRTSALPWAIRAEPSTTRHTANYAVPAHAVDQAPGG